MNNPVLISVIVPVYNTAPYLTQCLDSITGQSLKNINIIFIDDGSDDASNDILKEYSSKDDRFLILSQSHKGPGAARNLGIKAATGEFIAFMDSDDFYPEKTTLEKLYNAAKSNNVLISGGSFCEYNDKKLTKNNVFCGIFYGFTFNKREKLKYVDYQYDFGFYRFIYNREFILRKKIFFPDFSFFEDPPFFIKAMHESGEFFAIPDVVYVYRIGHKINKWPLKKIFDTVKSIICNLEFSESNELKKLYNLTKRRLLHYLKQFYMAIGTFSLMRCFLFVCGYVFFFPCYLYYIGLSRFHSAYYRFSVKTLIKTYIYIIRFYIQKIIYR